MGAHLKQILCLVWLVCIYMTGILIFTKGFLLTRTVVNQNRTCDEDFAGQTHNFAREQHGHSGCWMHARYKKAVFVIIDALRFDFVVSNSTDGEKELPYHNKLTTIQRLMENEPKHSRLFRFIADPPTTTMQRLKGLMTGSLPTFVDAGANFASTRITEDNLIDQMKKQNKNIVFLGDDTWMGLFPDQFKRAYPFPSFNVKDLHTVDNGVISHLIPEIKKNDWDVLIAHFLGVDHCGHRYGPDHSAMAEKLVQMDRVLSDVVKQLDEETVLFVLGDHGMTKTGDHGGDSWDELHAALFVYSPTQITSSPKQKGAYKRVPQIDLVPTVSLLLGLPVPFPNLGTAIADLFNHCPWWGTVSNPERQEFHAVKALHLNAHQVREYLIAYSNVSNDLPYSELERLDDLFERSETELHNLLTAMYNEGRTSNLLPGLKKLKEDYTTFLADVRTMCESIWAKFDMRCIILGLIITVTGVGLNLLLVVSRYTNEANLLVYGSVTVSTWITLLCIILYFMKLKLKLLVVSLFMGLVPIGFISLILWKLLSTPPPSSKVAEIKKSMMANIESDSTRQSKESSFVNIFASGIMAVYSCSLFSNSFIVNESSVTAFFFQTMVFVLAYNTFQNLSKQSQDRQQFLFYKKQKAKSVFDLGHLITSPGTIIFALAVMACACTRITQNFRACREEQWDCESPEFLRPLSALTGVSTQYKNLRYFLSAAMVGVVPIAVTLWMRYYGNLNGYEPGVLWIRYALPSSAISVCFHWALQALPSHMYDNLPVWQLVILPRIVYILSLVCLVILVLRPLCIYLLPQSQDDEMPFVGRDKDILIPKVYNHMKLHWKKHLKTAHSSDGAAAANVQRDEKPPLVYGLGTVYSSSNLLLVGTAAMVLYVLLGDGMSLTLTSLLLAMFLVLELCAGSAVAANRTDGHVPWSCVLIWGLLASEHFFSTGHHTTITALRWESAYNGFHGDFDNYAIPAFLIGMNTFASYVICTLALPLLLYWPYTRGHLMFAFERDKRSAEADRKGEFVLSETPEKLHRPLFKLFVTYVLFFGVKLLSSMICAAIQRRHLMVWKIFAPRFVYEAATFLVVSVLSVFVYLFVVRIERAVNKWVESVEQR